MESLAAKTFRAAVAGDAVTAAGGADAGGAAAAAGGAGETIPRPTPVEESAEAESNDVDVQLAFAKVSKECVDSMLVVPRVTVVDPAGFLTEDALAEARAEATAMSHELTDDNTRWWLTVATNIIYHLNKGVTLPKAQARMWSGAFATLLQECGFKKYATDLVGRCSQFRAYWRNKDDGPLFPYRHKGPNYLHNVIYAFLCLMAKMTNAGLETTPLPSSYRPAVARFLEKNHWDKNLSWDYLRSQGFEKPKATPKPPRMDPVLYRTLRAVQTAYLKNNASLWLNLEVRKKALDEMDAKGSTFKFNEEFVAYLRWCQDKNKAVSLQTK